MVGIDFGHLVGFILLISCMTHSVGDQTNWSSRSVSGEEPDETMITSSG